MSWNLKEQTCPVNFLRRILAFTRELFSLAEGHRHRPGAVVGMGPDAAWWWRKLSRERKMEQRGRGTGLDDSV